MSFQNKVYFIFNFYPHETKITLFIIRYIFFFSKQDIFMARNYKTNSQEVDITKVKFSYLNKDFSINMVRELNHC